MIYLVIKALHLLSVLLFVAGLLAGALQLAGASPAASGMSRKLREWHRVVTTAAMFAAWAFGLLLAGIGHWFPAPWLIVKLALVLALAALHGVLSGRLRHIESWPATTDGTALRWTSTIILLVTGVVVLAVLKMPAA